VAIGRQNVVLPILVAFPWVAVHGSVKSTVVAIEAEAQDRTSGVPLSAVLSDLVALLALGGRDADDGGAAAAAAHY